MQSKVKVNLIYNFLYHLFLIIVPLITTPYVSRRLGAAGVGDYAYAYSIANYYALFIKLGLNNYGNRAIAYTRDDRKTMSREFWNIYFFQFAVSVVVIFIYLAYSFWFSSNSQLSIYLIFFVISSGIDITWFYWGMEEFKVTVTRSIVIKIVSTIAIFIFIKDENDTGLYTLILSISMFLSQLLLWPRIFKYTDFVRPTYNEVTKHIKPNVLLFLPAIAVSFYKIMDKIMLGMLSTKTEVGFYESSEKIIKVPMAFIESLGGVMQPRMSNLISNKAEKTYLQDVLKKSVIVMMMASSIIGFGIMTIADDFVPLFYGSGFGKCSLLFKVLLPSCMFLALTNVMKTQFLLPRKQDKEYTIALFTGALVNMITNSILIPYIASIGAAVGTLIAEASVALVIGIIANKDIKISEYYSMAVPFIISGLIMFVFGQTLRFGEMNIYAGIALKIIFCGCIYVCTLLIQIAISKLFWKKEFYEEMISIVDGMNVYKRRH